MLDETSVVVDKSLSPTVRNTYMVAIALDNGRGVSIKSLQSTTGVSRRTVQNAISVLKAKKLIRIANQRAFVNKKSILPASSDVLDTIIKKLTK